MVRCVVLYIFSALKAIQAMVQFISDWHYDSDLHYVIFIMHSLQCESDTSAPLNNFKFY